MNPIFLVPESTALLHEIFPNYPDLREPRPVPDLAEFLERYRAHKGE